MNSANISGMLSTSIQRPMLMHFSATGKRAPRGFNHAPRLPMTNPLLEQFVSFIRAERDRFSTEDSNRFGMAFSKITRHYQFLLIIVGRYKEASDEFVRNTKDLQASFKPGEHPATEEQLRLQDEGRHLTTHLHLEIESFYLFAKILLDRIAH